MNDASSANSSGKLPRSAESILQMFRDVGIKDYEPQLLMQMTDLSYAITKQLLDEAKALSIFAGKKKIDQTDVEFTIKAFEEKHKPNRPSKLFLMELAAQKNTQPLAPLRQNFGLRLPNDRFCQVQPNFEFTNSLSNNSNSVPPAENISSNNFTEPINSISSEDVSQLLVDIRRPTINSKVESMPMEEDFD